MSGKRGESSAGGSRNVPRRHPVEEARFADALADRRDWVGMPANLERRPPKLPPMKPIKGQD